MDGNGGVECEVDGKLGHDVAVCGVGICVDAFVVGCDDCEDTLVGEDAVTFGEEVWPVVDVFKNVDGVDDVA